MLPRSSARREHFLRLTSDGCDTLYQLAGKTLNCNTCGQEFTTRYVGREVKFCSHACYGISRRKPKIEVECGRCDKSFLVFPGEIARAKRLGRQKVYCSRSCRARDRRRSFNSYAHLRLSDDHSYRAMATANGLILEHRLAMAQHIGRLLLPHEDVHHLNGNRSDNRIENLELWTRSHPKGQRVEEKIAWARSFLAEYGIETCERSPNDRRRTAR